MRRFFSLSGVLLVVACNSVLDIPEATLREEPFPADDDDSSSGDDDDLVCPDGEKACNGGCVGKDDPSTGCGGKSCDPCKVPNAAEATCVEGQCAVGTCQEPFRDCNEQASDGCEADLSKDPANCGTCGNTCGGGLKCTDDGCRCDNGDGDQCGNDGFCDTEQGGICHCGEDGECSPGAHCDEEDSCAF